MTEPMTEMTEEDNHLFDIFAKLHISIDTLNSEMAKRRQVEQQSLRNLPRSFPLPYSVSLDGNGNGLVSLKGPQPGREWIVRELTATHSGYVGIQNTGIHNTGAAGAATSATLNGPGIVTGFDVSFGVATVAGTATVTLSGVSGGPYTWTVDELTTNTEVLQQSLDLEFSTAAVLSVSAVASGGTVSINLFGTTDVSSADIAWYRGTSIANGQNVTLPSNLVFNRMHSTPEEKSYTSDVVRVVQNQEVWVGVQGGIPNGLIIGSMTVLDQPAFGAGKVVAVQ